MKPLEALTEPSAPTREEEQAEVIRRLEEDIIFGRFAPGSRLVEDTLMTRYGASRHFGRPGLFPLERQGLHVKAAELRTARGAESEHVARHLLRLPPAGDRKRVAVLREAAHAASGRGAAAATGSHGSD